MITITEGLFTNFAPKSGQFLSKNQGLVQEEITNRAIKRFHDKLRITNPAQEFNSQQKNAAVVWLGQLLDYFCNKIPNLRTALENYFSPAALNEVSTGDPTAETAVFPRPLGDKKS